MVELTNFHEMSVNGQADYDDDSNVLLDHVENLVVEDAPKKVHGKYERCDPDPQFLPIGRYEALRRDDLGKEVSCFCLLEDTFKAIDLGNGVLSSSRVTDHVELVLKSMKDVMLELCRVDFLEALNVPLTMGHLDLFFAL